MMQVVKPGQATIDATIWGSDDASFGYVVKPSQYFTLEIGIKDKMEHMQCLYTGQEVRKQWECVAQIHRFKHIEQNLHDTAAGCTECKHVLLMINTK